MVALVMPEQQRVGGDGCKGSIAGRTRRRFKAEAAVPLNVDLLDVASDTEAPAIVGTERGPASGIRREAVVHMHGLEPLAQAEIDENLQEDD